MEAKKLKIKIELEIDELQGLAGIDKATIQVPATGEIELST